MSTEANCSPWGVEVKPQSGGGDWEVCPEGNWGARLAAMIDVGHHEAHGNDGSPYQRRTLILCWELAAKKKDRTSFFIARTMTMSLAQNTVLYGIVKSLSGEKKLGECFDPAWIAGKGCLVQVTHSTKQKGNGTRTYANIEAVTALPQGMPFPAGDCVVWSIFERKALPDLSWVPPLYHEPSAAVKTVREWVSLSAEANQGSAPYTQAGDSRMPSSSSMSNPSRVEHVIDTSGDVPF